MSQPIEKLPLTSGADIPGQRQRHDLSLLQDLSNFCIFCRSEDLPLRGGDRGRLKILNSAKAIGDTSITDLTPVQFATIRYHSRSCYAAYTLRGDRAIQALSSAAASAASAAELEEAARMPSPPTTRVSKRRKTTSSSSSSSSVTAPNAKDKPCTVCGKNRVYISNHQYEYQRYRVCTVLRARKLINAASLFQDEVHARLSLYPDENAIFAADILAHNHCLKAYIKKYDDYIKTIFANLDLESDAALSADTVKQAFNSVVEDLDIEHNG